MVEIKEFKKWAEGLGVVDEKEFNGTSTIACLSTSYTIKYIQEKQNDDYISWRLGHPTKQPKTTGMENADNVVLGDNTLKVDNNSYSIEFRIQP